MAQTSLVQLTEVETDQMDLEAFWSLPLGALVAAMTLEQVQDHFKQFGKFIYGDHWGRDQTVALQKLMVGTVNQVRVADPAKYDDVSEAVIPFHTDMTKAINQSKTVRDYAKKACENLLTKAIALDLGLPSGSSVAAVGSALVELMSDVGATVAPAGIEDANKDGFSFYFKDTLNIELPESEEPTIPDSWIDDDLV